jgi:hypothetical protein
MKALSPINERVVHVKKKHFLAAWREKRAHPAFLLSAAGERLDPVVSARNSGLSGRSFLIFPAPVHLAAAAAVICGKNVL